MDPLIVLFGLGVWIGSGPTVRPPVGVMRATLAVVLTGAGLALIGKADSGLGPGFVIGIPVEKA